MTKYSFCNNCGKQGHLYHQCKRPITSIGIVCISNITGKKATRISYDMQKK